MEIELAGVKFKIDASANQKLNSYLNSLRHHFAKYEDGIEIIADLENRIAEKLADLRKNADDVLTSADVKKVTESMGEIEDFKFEINGGENMWDKLVNRFKLTRLKRSSNDQKIAGVAAGIANYLDIDPVIVRLTFCLLTIVLAFTASPFVFFPTLVYLALWASMPEDQVGVQAKPATKAEVKEVSAPAPASSPTPIARAVNVPIDVIGRVASALVTAIRKLAPITVSLTGVTIAILSLFGLVALSSAASIIMFNPDSPYIGLPIGLVFDLKTIYILTLLISIVIGIPLLALTLLGVSMARLKNIFRALPTLVGLGFWIVAIVVLVGFGFGNLEKAKTAIDQNPGVFTPTVMDLALENPSGVKKVTAKGNVIVRVIASPTPSLTLRALVKDFKGNGIQVRQVGETLEINDVRASEMGFCLFCIHYTPILTLSVPDIDGINAEGRVAVNVDRFGAGNLIVNLADSSNFYMESAFDKLTLVQKDHTRATLTGFVESLELNLSGISQVNALDVGAIKTTIEASDMSVGYVYAKDSLNITAQGNAVVYYTKDGEVSVTRRDAARVWPHRLGYGHSFSIDKDDVRDFLEYENRFSELQTFLHRAFDIIDNRQNTYSVTLDDGQTLIVDVDANYYLIESVKLMKGSGVEELVE